MSVDIDTELSDIMVVVAERGTVFHKKSASTTRIPPILMRLHDPIASY